MALGLYVDKAYILVRHSFTQDCPAICYQTVILDRVGLDKVAGNNLQKEDVIRNRTAESTLCLQVLERLEEAAAAEHVAPERDVIMEPMRQTLAQDLVRHDMTSQNRSSPGNELLSAFSETRALVNVHAVLGGACCLTGSLYSQPRR